MKQLVIQFALRRNTEIRIHSYKSNILISYLLTLTLRKSANVSNALLEEIPATINECIFGTYKSDWGFKKPFILQFLQIQIQM